MQKYHKISYVIINQQLAFIYIYLYIMYARIRATHFSGIGFSGNRHGSAFLLWIGVARVFPENGWTGVGFQVVAGHFQREDVDRGRRPHRVPVRPDSDKRTQKKSPRRHHLEPLQSYKGKANPSPFYTYPSDCYHLVRPGVHG